jgi:minor extracellular serine protease Vpr
MRRRLLIAVGASALLIAASLPMTAMGVEPKGTPHTGDWSTRVDPGFKPLLVNPEKQVSAVLQLSGASALARTGVRSEQRAAADAMKKAQDAAGKAATKLGAKVTGTYRYAYNGVRVQTTVGKLADLAGIKGVVAVRQLRQYTFDNTRAIPAIGAPATWTGGNTGAGVQVAIIDTGIDYLHANFGGAGDPADYAANNPATIESGTFPTAKVVGGYDFAGDGYDASGDDGSPFPDPDRDPLDCAAHGSHVAGSAAGMGVKSDHSTYTGTYNSSTIGDGSGFIVGPGVAPQASLFALKVFGCEGSTDLVVDALEWVAEYNAFHTDPIDVVNMSLGSPYGQNTDPDAVATNTLVSSGVVVVASAGNESTPPYITGAPAAATKAISVAAYDAYPQLPMATIDFVTLTDINGINQNNHPALPVNGDLFVVSDLPGTATNNEFLGCAASDYPAGVSGKIAVIQRGVCAFVDKGAAAQDAGAIGVIVVNRDDRPATELPAFLGYNPELFTIPMIGVANESKAALIAADGVTVSLKSAGTQANPGYQSVATFTSAGPRSADSVLKPDVAAPGVNIFSTGVGTGWNGTTMSGTSMAAPMTTGAVALLLHDHPTWSPLRVKAALANTASGALVHGYQPTLAGAGLIQVDKANAAATWAAASDGTTNLSFGYVAPKGAWKGVRTFTIHNDSASSVTYSLKSSSSAAVVSPTSVKIAAHRSALITVTASLSAKTVAALCSPDWSSATACWKVANTDLYVRQGVITATPKSPKTGQAALRVPFALVPRGASSIATKRDTTWTTAAGVTTGKLVLRNTGGHSGSADVYALGTTDVSGDGTAGTDIRAAGVQTLATADPADRLLVFAVNMYDRFTSFGPHQIDIQVDTTGDRVADFHVMSYEEGLFYAGAYDGYQVSLVTDASYNLLTDGPIDSFGADAPNNGSTVELSAPASLLGLTDGSGTFSYRVVAWDGYSGWPDSTAWARSFDAFHPYMSTGTYATVAAKSTKRIGAWFKPASSPLGWMVVNLDDPNGSFQADLVAMP